MAGSSKMARYDGGTPAGWSPIQFVFAPAPRRFTIATFARRLVQNSIAYLLILVAATYTCFIVFAPTEISLLLIACIAIAAVVVFLKSSSRRKLHRLVEAGLDASYIAAAMVHRSNVSQTLYSRAFLLVISFVGVIEGINLLDPMFALCPDELTWASWFNCMAHSPKIVRDGSLVHLVLSAASFSGAAVSLWFACKGLLHRM